MSKEEINKALDDMSGAVHRMTLAIDRLCESMQILMFSVDSVRYARTNLEKVTRGVK